MLESRIAFNNLKQRNQAELPEEMRALEGMALVEIAEALTNIADLLLEARNEGREGR